MKANTCKRLLALLACLAVLCACLAGCGGKDSGGASKDPAPASDGNEGGASGSGGYKDIVVGLPEDITNLDLQESNATANLMLNQCIHNRLISLNYDGTFACDLAESYEQVSATVWQFNLRKGVKFHNGSEMTADDVLFTYERARSSGAANDKVEMIAAVNKIDDYTVQFELTDQISDILYYIAYPTLGILNKAAVEADPVNGPTIGAGPYVFDSWSAGDSVKCHAFEDYWGGVKNTKNLTLRIMPEASSRVISLQNGEIDICVDPPAIELSHIADTDGLSLLQV